MHICSDLAKHRDRIYELVDLVRSWQLSVEEDVFIVSSTLNLMLQKCMNVALEENNASNDKDGRDLPDIAAIYKEILARVRKEESNGGH